MCQQGSACTRPLCFFAHSLEELRVVDHQSNTVVPAAQIAPVPGSVVPAAGLPPGAAGSSQAANMPGWAMLQGPSSEAVRAQQPWAQQQAIAQPLGGNPGPQMFNQPLAAVGFQQVAAQRPPMQQPVMQDAAIGQQQLPQLNNPQQLQPMQQQPQLQQLQQQPQLQQLQLQQMHALAAAQLQQMQGAPGVAVQQAPGMAGPSSSNFQQQQVPFNLAAAAAGLQQPQQFLGPQQGAGPSNQHAWQQMMFGAPQGQQQFAPAAGPQGQGFGDVGMQGIAAAAAGQQHQQQQQLQVHILQQPQQPWLQPQPQLGPGGGSVRPQVLQMNSGGQAAAALGGLGLADEAMLQAAMQQMGLQHNNSYREGVGG
eukprot:GHUV01016777.1.p1 GENE.GHUV01016777.1~~GHUV01016777.1.p1  ORF type:complete len:366 (+),score=199.59 GHUV01016777.1:238-1335(+)